jgi:hypothetical protein
MFRSDRMLLTLNVGSVFSVGPSKVCMCSAAKIAARGQASTFIAVFHVGFRVCNFYTNRNPQSVRLLRIRPMCP